MFKPRLSIRGQIALNFAGVLPLLAFVTLVVFTKIHKTMLLLRDVQAGEIVPDEEALDALASAAMESFARREQYEVVEVLEDYDGFVQNDAVLTAIHNSSADDVTRDTIILRMARNAANAGWFDKSADRYREYLDVHPSRVIARAELAGLLLTARRRDESIDEYQALIERQPARSEWLLRLADAALTGTRAAGSTGSAGPEHLPEPHYLQQAHAVLQQALELDDNCIIRRRLATVQSWVGADEQVLATLRPCHPVELADAEVARAFAQALARTSNRDPIDTQNIMNLADAVIAAPAADANLTAALARALRELGRFDRSACLFEQAVELRPHNRAVRFELANLLHDIERFEQAEEHYVILLAQIREGELK